MWARNCTVMSTALCKPEQTTFEATVPMSDERLAMVTATWKSTCWKFCLQAANLQEEQRFVSGLKACATYQTTYWARTSSTRKSDLAVSLYYEPASTATARVHLWTAGMRNLLCSFIWHLAETTLVLSVWSPEIVEWTANLLFRSESGTTLLAGSTATGYRNTCCQQLRPWARFLKGTDCSCFLAH